MIIACIPAGGTGERMGHEKTPKQYLKLNGKEILAYSVEKFLAVPEIDRVIVGVHADRLSFCENLKNKHFKGEERLNFCEGGSDRNSTIQKAVAFSKAKFKPEKDDIFVTHDAVRPFVTVKMIRDNIAAAREYGICGTVIEAVDTIVCSSDGEFISGAPLRKELFQCQTPQSFRLGLYEDVVKKASRDEMLAATDVCTLFFKHGYKVKLVEGDISNIKITYPFDYKLAKFIAESGPSGQAAI